VIKAAAVRRHADRPLKVLAHRRRHQFHQPCRASRARTRAARRNSPIATTRAPGSARLARSRFT
jgi:hypothetical protein